MSTSSIWTGRARPRAAAGHPLGAALSGLLPRGEVPLDMMAEPFAIPGKKEAAVAVMVGVRQPIRETGLRTTERVGFQVNAFNVDGKSFGAKRMDVTVTLRAEATGMGEYELLSRMDLKPGRYQLRVALNRQEQLAAEMFAKDRSADINIGIPLERMAPGSYLLTLESTLNKTTAKREVRFDVVK